MEDPKKKLVELIQGAAQPVRKRARPRPAQSITGHHNIQAGGDVHISTEKIVHKTEVKTGDGVIDAAQKQTLKELVAEWVTVHNRVKRAQLSYGAAWSRFQRHFRVNKYAELPAGRFAEAVKWLQRQRAMIDTMKTAARRDAQWRARQITYIKARCKSPLGDERAYLPYIELNFGKTSLADLTDDELARAKSHIAHKKPA